MNFAVIDRETLAVKNVYWSESDIDESRPDFTPDVIHVQVPETLNYFDILATRSQDGTITITEDPVKVQTRIDSKFIQVRSQRNKLLIASDWTQFTDSPLTPDKKTEWATYRQALRDLPGTVTDPTWPTAPS
jgi:hypothetical protein